MIWADSGYQGKLVDRAATWGLTVQIVRKLTGQTTFVVQHRRWVVERSFSWINRSRRTVRDYERLPQHHAAMVQWSMIIIMTRRLARYQTTGKLPTLTTRTHIDQALTAAALAAAVHDCRACPLYAGATHAVLSRGPRQATIVTVGDQPSDEDDLAGQPFLGAAGHLLFGR